MYSFISILVVLFSVLLVLVVLVQNSKGGGLASNFSSSNQIMGVRKTTDFLEKATWSLAGALMILSFVAVMTIAPAKSTQSTLDEKVEKMAPTQSQNPEFPVADPNAQKPAEEKK